MRRRSIHKVLLPGMDGPPEIELFGFVVMNGIPFGIVFTSLVMSIHCVFFFLIPIMHCQVMMYLFLVCNFVIGSDKLFDSASGST
jgi:hypothetical protein